VFRVPLVDAATQMSSTGKYPWNIGGSRSTFVYVKNVTDQPREYTIYLSFGGDYYTIGLKRVEAGQTAVFDLRTLYDKRVADINGKPIPPEVTSGQVIWSVRGPDKRALIGRAEQVDTSGGVRMTSCGP